MYARGGNEIDVQDSASTAKSTESSIAKSTAPSSTASATDKGTIHRPISVNPA